MRLLFEEVSDIEIDVIELEIVYRETSVEVSYIECQNKTGFILI